MINKIVTNRLRILYSKKRELLFKVALFFCYYYFTANPDSAQELDSCPAQPAGSDTNT